MDIINNQICCKTRTHIECLKYAHENGYPWAYDTIPVALEKGHLECVEYARQNGCPEWNELMPSLLDSI